MKALLPEKSNGDATKSNGMSNNVPTHAPKGVDSIHARLRRLEARIVTLELKASIARRDVDRISKRQYRASEPSPRQNSPEPDYAGLFG